MGFLRKKIRRGRNSFANLRAGFAAKKYLSGQFNIVIVCGQKRSGNHAFLNWFLLQCEGPSLHYNHIRPRQIPTERQSRFFRPGQSGAVPTFVFSYEDRNFDEIFAGPLAGFLADHADQIVDKHFAIVMRSPKNLIASRLQKWPLEHQDPERRAKITNRLAAYATLVLSPPESIYDLKFTPVLFDAFIASSTYRDRLSDCFGITRGGRGLDEVTSFGHGSSFDGVPSDPSKMNLNKRWHLYRDDPVFRAFMADHRLQQIAGAYDVAVESAQQTAD